MFFRAVSQMTSFSNIINQILEKMKEAFQVKLNKIVFGYLLSSLFQSVLILYICKSSKAFKTLKREQFVDLP